MQPAPSTLGEVLYAGAGPRPAPEAEWTALVQLVAAGDRLSLQALFARMHRMVFTLILRLVSNRQLAEDLTLQVFDDVRRDARHPGDGTVVAWIMNLARARAMARLREDGMKRSGPRRNAALMAIEAPDYRHVRGRQAQERTLRDALGALTTAEREAIEAVYFGEKPATPALRGRIRTGLYKLRESTELNPCRESERLCTHALRALPAEESVTMEAHLPTCPRCRRELEALRPVVESFVAWPTDVLRAPASLHERFAASIAAETGAPARPAAAQVPQPEWAEVAPKIEVKMLAADQESHVVSMLVRLAPGGEYPAHSHAGVEELHLLHGELWIDERKLHPGDYNRAEPGTSDKRVWSETGCSCVLVTSTRDVLA